MLDAVGNEIGRSLAVQIKMKESTLHVSSLSHDFLLIEFSIIDAET